MSPDRTGSRLRATLIVLLAVVAAALVPGTAAAQGPGVSLSAGSVDKRTGQSVTLTARVRSLPPGASIVIIGLRNGRRVYASACAPRVLVCVRRVRSTTALTIQFRAVVRRSGRVLRTSRFVLVRWRPPPPPPLPLRPVLKLIRVIPQGFPTSPDCMGGAPTGGGSHTVTLVSSAGDAVFRWSLPAEIVNGPNSASIAVTSTRNAQSGSMSSYQTRILFSAGTAFTPAGAVTDLITDSTNTSLSGSYTFTPSSGSFDEGAGLSYIIIGTSCGGLAYEYRRELG